MTGYVVNVKLAKLATGQERTHTITHDTVKRKIVVTAR